MSIDKSILDYDEYLFQVSKSMQFLSQINPVNEVEEKEKFLTSSSYEPQFSYSELTYDPLEVTHHIKTLEYKIDLFSTLLFKKAEEIISKNEILQNRGNKDKVKELSIKLHGKPTDNLILQANSILSKKTEEKETNLYKSTELKKYLEDALSLYNLNDWNITISNKYATTVYPEKKEITICKNKLFTKSDLERLSIHEVSIHVLRAENGYNQPLKLFSYGLDSYTSTEEGLALYAEEINGYNNFQLLKRYAARVIATKFLLDGESFRTTFNHLKDLNLSNSSAWNTTLRLYRAGGYVKDYLYLEEKNKVAKYINTHQEESKILFIGKIGLDHIEMIKDLLNCNKLNNEYIIPNYFNQ